MSYRKIFSVVNEHTASTVTARYAISLAAGCMAELVLYTAHDVGSDETLLRHTKRHLDQLFTVAFDLNIPVTRITEVGDIAKLLPKRARAEKADLVFYPLTPEERCGANLTVKKRISSNLLKTQTVHHLLRGIEADLAVMRAVTMAKPHPGHILVPLGKVVSDKGRRLKFVTELAKCFHSRVTLYHLSAEGGTKGMPEGITHFREQLQKREVTVLERHGQGQLGKAVTVEAITRHIDLIIVGASERGTLRKLFFGNPADDVMHQPPCNTILFRAAP